MKQLEERVDRSPGAVALAREREELLDRLLSIERRLLDLEDAQAWEARTPLLERLGRRVRQRLWRSLSPCAGHLRQHRPCPMRIPAWYGHTRLPQPAPAIAMVTPSLNQSAFVERTIRSVQAQKYPRLDYVVGDGGSTDGTRDLLAAWPTPLQWDSRRDSGQAQAVNRGFARTEGEIMGWLNADDLLLPGALACVAGFFAEHPAVDVVYGHRIVIDEKGREIGRWVVPDHDDGVLAFGDYIPQETLFWRRALWDKTGGRLDESFQFALDWELLLRFRAAGARFAVIPRFLGAFRAHPSQKTASLMASQGRRECDLLRERLHGRYVPLSECGRALDGYLNQSSLRHALYRLGLIRY